jgi:hypothetical protein
MWTEQQRQRMWLEHLALQKEDLDQFSVYHDRSVDAYSSSGVATTSSGNHYLLWTPLPTGYPYERPSFYITDPQALRTFDGTLVSSLGVSHHMHTLTPHTSGWPQICHWRDVRWHSGIMLYKVYLKCLVWLEAYEQHLATGRPLADFVTTMAQTP